MFEIEKSIPLPKPNGRRSKIYPFEAMKIGDSFLVPLDVGKSPSGIFSAVSQAKKRLEISLTTARVEGGVRVWRIAGPHECKTCGSSLFEDGQCGTCPSTAVTRADGEKA
jgi:hypothetical protein